MPFLPNLNLNFGQDTRANQETRTENDQRRTDAKRESTDGSETHGHDGPGITSHATRRAHSPPRKPRAAREPPERTTPRTQAPNHAATHTHNAPTLKNHETSHTDCWPLSGPAARYGPMHHVRPHSTVLAWSLLAKSNPPNALRHTSLCAPQIYPTWAHTQPHRDERARAREPGSTLD